MKTIDKTTIMENTLKIHLDRILTQICKIMKKYEENPNSEENFLNIIYSHPIYKNRKEVEKFSSIIEKAGVNFKEKIMEIKDKSDMRQKRLVELQKINNFIDNNYEKLLMDINKEDKNLLLTSQLELSENDDLINDEIEEKQNKIKKIRENKKFLKKKEKI